MNKKGKYRKNALIIAGGEIKDYNKMKELILPSFYENTMVISADRGVYNTMRLGFKPHVLIGDMDSIDSDIKDKYKHELSFTRFISAPPDKDESDTRLAVEYAVGKGIKDIMITGASGGRLDHTFANLMMLASPGLEDLDIRILTENMEAFLIERPCTIKGEPGKLISIFSVTPHTTFIRTEGLKYELKNERLQQSPVRGLSNVFTAREALLEFSDGKLLIIKEL